MPADTVFSPGPLVDEIASAIILQDWPKEACTIHDVLNTVFRTGNIDAGKEILSLFATRSPSFSASLRREFSWEQLKMYTPAYFLDKKSSGIQELLEEYGADSNCVMYYTMASVPDISYWEEIFENGVEDKVLNSLLFFSVGHCPTGHVEFLLSKGASVHFQSCFAPENSQGWTALAHAAGRGRMDMVMLLLNNGADVLQEIVGHNGKFTIGQLADPRHSDLARMLTQVEREERAKRGTAHGLSLLIVPALCLIGSMCELNPNS